MWRYFTYKNTLRYIDILQDLVKAYNTRGHRTLNYHTPKSVTKENEQYFWKLQFKQNKKLNSKPQFKVGDLVRLSKLPGVFTKGYMRTFTRELFTIHSIRQTSPITYTIRDKSGEVLHGQFYSAELSLVLKDD